MEFAGSNTQSAAAPEFELDALPHDRSQCLECMLAVRLSSSSTEPNTHSPELSSSSRTDSGAINPSATVEVANTAERKEAERERSASQGEQSEEERKGKEGTRSLTLGEESQKRRGSRSPSPLVGMKRVNSESVDMDSVDSELREEGEMKESSVDDSSQETSGKEGSSSQSSGAKGIPVGSR